MNSREKRLARVNPKLLDLMERRAELEDRALYVDVVRVRKRTGMSQTLFARRFGFPVATLRHWERRDRVPRGPALVLLTVISREPNAVLRALSRQRRDDYVSTPTIARKRRAR
jgi:DNA-binding transcriptional regulator YiaG